MSEEPVTRKVVTKKAVPPDDFVGCWTCRHYTATTCTKYGERVERYYFCTSYIPKV